MRLFHKILSVLLSASLVVSPDMALMADFLAPPAITKRAEDGKDLLAAMEALERARGKAALMGLHGAKEDSRELLSPPIEVVRCEFSDGEIQNGTITIAPDIAREPIAARLGIPVGKWDEFWMEKFPSRLQKCMKRLRLDYPGYGLFEGSRNMKIVFGKTGGPMAYWDKDGTLVITLDLLAENPPVELAQDPATAHLVQSSEKEPSVWRQAMDALLRSVLIHEGLVESQFFHDVVTAVVSPEEPRPEILAALTEIYASYMEVVCLSGEIHQHPLFLEVYASPSNDIDSLPLKQILALGNEPERVMEGVRNRLMEASARYAPNIVEGMRSLAADGTGTALVQRRWKDVSTAMELAQQMGEAARTTQTSMRHHLHQQTQMTLGYIDFLSESEDDAELIGFFEKLFDDDSVKLGYIQRLYRQYGALCAVAHTERKAPAIVDYPGGGHTYNIADPSILGSPSDVDLETQDPRLRVTRALLKFYQPDFQYLREFLDRKAHWEEVLGSRFIPFTKKRDDLKKELQSLRDWILEFRKSVDDTEPLTFKVENVSQAVDTAAGPAAIRLAMTDAKTGTTVECTTDMLAVPALAVSKQIYAPQRFWRSTALPMALAWLTAVLAGAQDHTWTQDPGAWGVMAMGVVAVVLGGAKAWEHRKDLRDWVYRKMDWSISGARTLPGIPSMGYQRDARVELYRGARTWAWHAHRVAQTAPEVAKLFGFKGRLLQRFGLACSTHDLWKREEGAWRIINKFKKFEAEDHEALKGYTDRSEGILVLENTEPGRAMPIKLSREEILLVRHHRHPWGILSEGQISDPQERYRMLQLESILFAVNEVDPAPHHRPVRLAQMGDYLQEKVIAKLRKNTLAHIQQGVGNGKWTQDQANKWWSDYSQWLDQLVPAVVGVYAQQEAAWEKQLSELPELGQKVEYLIRTSSSLEYFSPYTVDELLQQLRLDSAQRDALQSLLDGMSDPQNPNAPFLKIHCDRYILRSSMEELRNEGLLWPLVDDRGVAGWIQAMDRNELLQAETPASARIHEVLRGEDFESPELIYFTNGAYEKSVRTGTIGQWVNAHGEILAVEGEAFRRYADRMEPERGTRIPVMLSATQPWLRAYVFGEDLPRLVPNKLDGRFVNLTGHTTYWPSSTVTAMLGDPDVKNTVLLYAPDDDGELTKRHMPLGDLTESDLVEGGYVPIQEGVGHVAYALQKNMDELRRTGKIVPIKMLNSGTSTLDSCYVSREYLEAMRQPMPGQKRQVETVIGTLLEGGVGNILVGARDHRGLSELFQTGLFVPMFTRASQAPQYVFADVEEQLVASGQAHYALLTDTHKASLSGRKVLVSTDGLIDVELRKGMREYRNRELQNFYDDAGSKLLIDKAFRAAADHYGRDHPAGLKEGFEIDEALALARLVAQPVDTRVPAELVAAALLAGAKREQVSETFPPEVWSWIEQFKMLQDRTEYNPPLRMSREKREVLKEYYVQNYIHLIAKFAANLAGPDGQPAKPLLLYFAYKLNFLMHAQERSGIRFEDEYRFIVDICSTLAEKLQLHKMSQTLGALSFKKAHRAEYDAILRQFEDSFGVSNEDLDCYAQMLEKELNAELDRAGIKATVSFNVKSPESIFAKLKKDGLPLDQLDQLNDVVRGRIVVKDEEVLQRVLELMEAPNSPLRILRDMLSSSRDKLKSTAVSQKVVGFAPTVSSATMAAVSRDGRFREGRKYSQDVVAEIVRKVAGDETWARSVVLKVEVQMQTQEMRDDELTGGRKTQHGAYKVMEQGHPMEPSVPVLEKTRDMDNLLRHEVQGPQCAGMDFVLLGTPEEGETVFYPFRVPNKDPNGPTVLDILARRDPKWFKEMLLNPGECTLNGKLVQSFGQRVTTGDKLVLKEGKPSPALANQVAMLQGWFDPAVNNKNRSAAETALVATNPQSRLLREIVLDNMPENTRQDAYLTVSAKIHQAVSKMSNGSVQFKPTEEQRREGVDANVLLEEQLKPVLLAQGFRGSQLLAECCMAIKFGIDPQNLTVQRIANAALIERGRELLAAADVNLSNEIKEMMGVILGRNKPYLIAGIKEAEVPNGDGVFWLIGTNHVSVGEIGLLCGMCANAVLANNAIDLGNEIVIKALRPLVEESILSEGPSNIAVADYIAKAVGRGWLSVPQVKEELARAALAQTQLLQQRRTYRKQCRDFILREHFLDAFGVDSALAPPLAEALTLLADIVDCLSLHILPQVIEQYRAEEALLGIPQPARMLFEVVQGHPRLDGVLIHEVVQFIFNHHEDFLAYLFTQMSKEEIQRWPSQGQKLLCDPDFVSTMLSHIWGVQDQTWRVDQVSVFLDFVDPALWNEPVKRVMDSAGPTIHALRVVDAVGQRGIIGATSILDDFQEVRVEPLRWDLILPWVKTLLERLRPVCDLQHKLRGIQNPDALMPYPSAAGLPMLDADRIDQAPPQVLEAGGVRKIDHVRRVADLLEPAVRDLETQMDYWQSQVDRNQMVPWSRQEWQEHVNEMAAAVAHWNHVQYALFGHGGADGHFSVVDGTVVFPNVLVDKMEEIGIAIRKAKQRIYELNQQNATPQGLPQETLFAINAASEDGRHLREEAGTLVKEVAAYDSFLQEEILQKWLELAGWPQQNIFAPGHLPPEIVSIVLERMPEKSIQRMFLANEEQLDAPGRDRVLRFVEKLNDGAGERVLRILKISPMAAPAPDVPATPPEEEAA